MFFSILSLLLQLDTMTVISFGLFASILYMVVFCNVVLMFAISSIAIHMISRAVMLCLSACGRYLFRRRRSRHRVCHRCCEPMMCFPGAYAYTKANEMCTVCLEMCTDSVLECGHAFHWRCVAPWLVSEYRRIKRSTCPICRRTQVSA